MIIYNSVPHRLTLPGAIDTVLLTSSFFFKRDDARSPSDVDTSLLARRVERRVAAGGCMKLIGDIEHWDWESRDAIAALLAMTRFIRDRWPRLELGWYGVFPARSVYAHRVTSAWRRQMHARLRPRDERGRFTAADPFSEAGRVHPSLYAFEGQRDFSGWRDAAELDLAIARQAGVPVEPFLCPYFHRNGGKTANNTPVPWFEQMLRWCHDNRLAPVIWTEPDDPVVTDWTSHVAAWSSII